MQKKMVSSELVGPAPTISYVLSAQHKAVRLRGVGQEIKPALVLKLPHWIERIRAQMPRLN